MIEIITDPLVESGRQIIHEMLYFIDKVKPYLLSQNDKELVLGSALCGCLSKEVAQGDLQRSLPASPILSVICSM